MGMSWTSQTRCSATVRAIRRAGIQAVARRLVEEDVLAGSGGLFHEGSLVTRVAGNGHDVYLGIPDHVVIRGRQRLAQHFGQFLGPQRVLLEGGYHPRVLPPLNIPQIPAPCVQQFPAMPMP